MTVINPPAWLQAGSYTARDDRLVTASIVKNPGVVQTGDLAVTQNSTPGMSVIVAGGRAWIEDGVAGGDVNKGMYNFVNDGSVTKTITTSHATQYRVDRVIALVEDSAVSGSTDLASLVVLAGTTSATLGGAQALVPAVPSGAVSLATVTVGPAVTSITNSNITNNTVTASLYPQMSGDAVAVTSTTRPTGNDRFVPMRIFETDTLREWQWTGDTNGWQFRGGKGPKAFVSRPGSWGLSTSTQSLTSLEAATGSNFETAYFTFVDSGSGDRIRLKQAGLYTLEIYAELQYVTDDYYASIRPTFAVGTTGLPSGMGAFPALYGKWPAGTAKMFGSRTIFLPEGMEIAYEYDAGVSGVTANVFWASATLIG